MIDLEETSKLQQHFEHSTINTLELLTMTTQDQFTEPATITTLESLSETATTSQEATEHGIMTTLFDFSTKIPFQSTIKSVTEIVIDPSSEPTIVTTRAVTTTSSDQSLES